MEKNNKGRTIIRSIEELRPSERRQLDRATYGVGALFVLNYFLLLLLYFGSPSLQWASSFESVGILLFLCIFSVLPFWLGRDLGFCMTLADMGYAFPRLHYSARFYQTQQNPFSSSSSDASTIHFSSNYTNSPSINPSSGLPISGSSGVDTSGNPYGSRSW